MYPYDDDVWSCMIMTMIVVFNAVVGDVFDDDEVIKASYVYEAVNFISD